MRNSNLETADTTSASIHEASENKDKGGPSKAPQSPEALVQALSDELHSNNLETAHAALENLLNHSVIQPLLIDQLNRLFSSPIKQLEEKIKKCASDFVKAVEKDQHVEALVTFGQLQGLFRTLLYKIKFTLYKKERENQKEFMGEIEREIKEEFPTLKTPEDESSEKKKERESQLARRMTERLEMDLEEELTTKYLLGLFPSISLKLLNKTYELFNHLYEAYTPPTTAWKLNHISGVVLPILFAKDYAKKINRNLDESLNLDDTSANKLNSGLINIDIFCKMVKAFQTFYDKNDPESEFNRKLKEFNEKITSPRMPLGMGFFSLFKNRNHIIEVLDRFKAFLEENLNNIDAGAFFEKFIVFRDEIKTLLPNYDFSGFDAVKKLKEGADKRASLALQQFTTDSVKDLFEINPELYKEARCHIEDANYHHVCNEGGLTASASYRAKEDFYAKKILRDDYKKKVENASGKLSRGVISEDSATNIVSEFYSKSRDSLLILNRISRKFRMDEQSIQILERAVAIKTIEEEVSANPVLSKATTEQRTREKEQPESISPKKLTVKKTTAETSNAQSLLNFGIWDKKSTTRALGFLWKIKKSEKAQAIDQAVQDYNEVTGIVGKIEKLNTLLGAIGEWNRFHNHKSSRRYSAVQELQKETVDTQRKLIASPAA